VVRYTQLYCWYLIISNNNQDIATYYVTDVVPTISIEQITDTMGVIYKKGIDMTLALIGNRS
jgi:hypothetical protein